MCMSTSPDGLCSICGASPCYFQCPNSPEYYSPERERYDDMIDDGSDDHRERYAATAEASQYDDREWDEGDTFTGNADGSVTLTTQTGGQHTYDPDDIPF